MTACITFLASTLVLLLRHHNHEWRMTQARYDILVTLFPVWSSDCCSVPRLEAMRIFNWTPLEPDPKDIGGVPMFRNWNWPVPRLSPPSFSPSFPRGFAFEMGSNAFQMFPIFLFTTTKWGGCVLLLHSHSEKSLTSAANCCSKFRVKIPGIWPKGRTLKSSQEKGRWSGRREFQESWKRERKRG